MIPLIRGGQLLSHRDNVLQLLRHVVQVLRQLPNFIISFTFNNYGKISLAPGFGCFRESVDPSAKETRTETEGKSHENDNQEYIQGIRVDGEYSGNDKGNNNTRRN